MISCVLWNSTQNIKHFPQCVWTHRDLVFSGGLEGEICFWVHTKSHVLACSLPAKRCLYLTQVKSPNEVLLGSKEILVSLHEDSRIRTWDFKDGRCLNVEKVPDCGKIAGLESSKNRIIAVVFQDTLAIYDSWTLQKLQNLKSSSKVLRAAFYTGHKIVLLNSQGELIFWHYVGTVIDPEPYFSLAVGSKYSHFELSTEFNLIALQSVSQVEVYKIDTLKLKTPTPYIIIQTNIKSYQFSNHFLIISTDQAVFTYQISEILEKIQEGLTDIPIEYQSVYIENTDSFLVNGKLFSIRNDRLSYIDILQDSLKTVSLDFEIPSNEFPFLDKDEYLTYSLIVTETWQILIGTSKGKVIISSLTKPDPKIIHDFQSSSVVCIKIIKKHLIAASAANELFVRLPSGKYWMCCLTSPAKDFIPITCIQDSSSESSQFWKNSWKNWEETFIVHLSDNSFSIVSLITQQSTIHFLSNILHIAEAVIQVKQEYLLVKSQETVYVYSLMTESLERIMSGISASEALRKSISFNSKLDFHSSEDLPCDEHRVIETNWRKFSIKKSLKFSQLLLIQETNNPILVIPDIPDQRNVNKILSILTCWDSSCSSHHTLVATIPELEKLIFFYHFGLRGDGWFSFYISSNSRYSKYIDTTRASILAKLSKLSCPDFRLSLGVLSYKSVNGNKSSQTMIRDLVNTLTVSKKEKVVSECRKIIQLRTPTYKVVQKSLEILGKLKNAHIDSEWLRTKSSLAESQAAVLLPYFSGDLTREVTLMAATSLFSMIRCDTVKADSVSKVLKHTLNDWKSLITPQIKNILKEVINVLANNGSESCYKIISSLALCDLKNFLQVANDEIEKSDHGNRKAWLSAIKWLVSHKYLQFAYYSQGTIEIILKVLSPHNPTVRKLSAEACTEILHLLVKKLPMVDFSQIKQKIAAGTSGGAIYIYDLKTASFWKCLEGHTGPLSAVMFSSTGNSIISYSSHDLTVRLWKIEVRFYEELFSAKNITPSQIISLNQVKGGVNLYKETLLAVRFVVNNGLRLVREDLKEYEINMNLV